MTNWAKIENKQFPEFGSRTKNTVKTVYSNEYTNMTSQQRIERVSLISSDNGNCWWVYEYLKRNPQLIDKK